MECALPPFDVGGSWCVCGGDLGCIWLEMPDRKCVLRVVKACASCA